MQPPDALQRLKFLYDQVHQTAERIEHLPQSLPLDIAPASLNYEKDLSRLQGEYNRLVQQLEADGLLYPAELEAQRLPHSFTSPKLNRHPQRNG
jgi:hypothetical protein